MPSANRVILAVAGSGKTTTIVQEAISKPHRKIAIITYTINNENEIRAKFYNLHGSIPPNVTITTWYTFLLSECARPYQNYVYSENRIESIAFNNGRSAKYAKKTDAKRYYLNNGRDIYRDKITAFICECERMTKGKVLARLSRIYDEIYIDEVQDLAGYDLDFVELLLKSNIDLLLVGDHRQATYSTNDGARNTQFRGSNIIKLFEDWSKKKLCEITYLTISHRCNQAICNFADKLFSTAEKTQSNNHIVSGHDGVFIIPKESVPQYVERYSPQILRYNKTTNCLGLNALNFGEAKGLGFDRVLIFPNGPIERYISSGDINHVGDISKFYVAITRARYSVAFIFSGNCKIDGVSQFSLSDSVTEKDLQYSLFA